MAQRTTVTEANKRGIPAVRGTKHSVSFQRLQPTHPVVLRMPVQYSVRDVEVLLDALWQMFTESQAKKLKVTMPWDESDEPQQIMLSDLAALLESWIKKSA